MSAVLVTGATGYIGRSLLPALSTAGFTVIPHSSAWGDIGRCDLPVADVSQVIHLAGKTFVPASWQTPREFYDVNVMGAVNVAEHCRRVGASLLLLSSYMYGRPEQIPTPEDHPAKAVNPYGHSKLLAEESCRFYEQYFNVPLTIARLFNVYGGDQPDHFLIPSLVRQARDPESKELVVQDDTPLRDYIHLDDCVELLVRMVSSPRPGTYNVGSGMSYGVREIAAILNRLIPNPKPLRSLREARSSEIPETRADITRAREAFGWQPSVSLEDGVTRLLRSSDRSP